MTSINNSRDTTDRKQLEARLALAQKMESIGQLAAGIAHEINTPAQYVSDNICFLHDAFHDLEKLLGNYARLLDANKAGTIPLALLAEIDAITAAADLSYLMTEIPQAIQQSQQGIERVTKIVRAMKEFSHPSVEEKSETDLNRAVETTITVARNEWKYVAELVTDFDPTLPPVRCLPGEFNQVILNLIVNAAHAIADVVGNDGNNKGTIIVRTRHDENWAEIRISDTGTGIPEAIRLKIFDPFFTTKVVGKGTGQGLAIAHSVIVDKHGGTISCETEVGKGTTFIIRLPLLPSTPQAETLL
jgi:signal transduction histidine kinase